ncbi:MAG: UDP-N-acetylmuramate--L-alanine ligase [Flavobacteriaceae bacterium]|nr:UDP-N-acetylmuramate--L-alanine ligase [Flavobacteriaceae bacterium]
MLDDKAIKYCFFLGIGGIGMSALAKYLRLKGYKVAGYDRTASEASAKLADLGISVIHQQDIELVDQAYLNTTEACVIYTPAINANQPLYQDLASLGLHFYKRSDVLGQLSKNRFTIAIAGTHGKTTTSTILTHVLKASGKKITALLGGVYLNTQDNFVHTGDDLLVLEADEFDRTFLKLHPDILAITTSDIDHKDIYASQEEVDAAFQTFAKKANVENRVINAEIPIEGTHVGFEASADAQLYNLRLEDGITYFNIKTNTQVYDAIPSLLHGKHNVFNTGIAVVIALKVGCPMEKIKAALLNFKGIYRRFQRIFTSKQCIYIDDYAHHPTELKALLLSVKNTFPKYSIELVFQPHLFSRTRDFADDFARVLADVDRLFLLDIYPAREQPISGVDAAFLLQKIHQNNPETIKTHQLASKEEIPDLILKNKEKKVLLSVGAGDIELLVPTIKSALSYAV